MLCVADTNSGGPYWVEVIIITVYFITDFSKKRQKAKMGVSYGYFLLTICCIVLYSSIVKGKV